MIFFLLIKIIYELALANASSERNENWFNQMDLELTYINQKAADLTWKAMLGEETDGMMDVAAYKISWTTDKCSELNAFDYLNSTELRMQYLLCRGPLYSLDENSDLLGTIGQLNAIYEESRLCHSSNICLPIEPDLEQLMRKSRDPELLLWAWTGWRDITGPPSLKIYPHLIRLENNGARRSGYQDAGECWREELEIPNLQDVAQNLYEAISPFHKRLHAFVRYALVQFYGKHLVPPKGPLPAHLLETNETNSISADYETAISNAGFGRFNYMVFGVSLIASSMPATSTSVLSYVLPVATCDLELSPFRKGVLNVAAFFGMSVSGFLWGFLADAIGRKRLMTAGFVLDAAIVVAASLSASFWQMAILKFFDGLVICGPYSIFMTYMSEVFSSDRRKIVFLSSGLFMSLGNVSQSVLAWLIIPGNSQYNLFGLIPLKSWRLFMLINAVPVLLCGIGCFFFVESPNFLLEKGRKEEALEALRRIYSINTGLPASSYPIRYLIDSRGAGPQISAISIKNKALAGLKEASTIFRPPYVLIILQFCFYQVASMLGLNLTRLWLPQLLSDRDSTVDAAPGLSMCDIISKPEEILDLKLYCENLVVSTSLFLTMITLYSGYIVGQAIFLSTVSRIGKKIYTIMTVTIATVAFATLPNIPAEYVLIPSLFAASTLNVTYYCLLGTIVEVFPTPVRATSLSTIVSVGRLGTVITNLFVASLLYTHCAYVYYFVCALSGAAAIGSFFMPTEPIVKEEDGSPAERDN